MEYRRRYKAASFYFTALEYVAYCQIVVGILALIAGLGRGPGHFELFPIISGIATIIFGFFQVVFIQIGRAVVDSAEMTREMLFMMREDRGGGAATSSTRRREPSLPTGPKLGELFGAPVSSEATVDDAGTASDDSFEERDHEGDVEYKGHTIYRKGDQYYIEGFTQGYVSIRIAKIVIDRGDL